MAGQPAPDFAGLVQQLRAEAGLTQEELAQAAGLAPRTVSDLERGVHRTAHQDTARRLADALGLAEPVRGLLVAAARGRVSAVAVLAARGGVPRLADGFGGNQADVERLLGAVSGSPYCGLKAFGEQDAMFFFGREAATATLVERLSRLVEGTGLLVVSGVSGAGKSSLLRAGVLPQVRKSGLAGAPEAAAWPSLVFTPTRAPLDELALRVGLLARVDAAGVRRGLAADPAGFALTVRQAVLAQQQEMARGRDRAAEGDERPGQQRVVLVVDQFEQLFTLCTDEEQRQRFITALHAAATTGHEPQQAPAGLVVLGVRADFEARCADYPLLAGAVQDRYLVTAMTERQLRMAITEPAKKAGSPADADLVEVLLSEMRTSHPGASGAGVLPLLSHALDQAWRSRAGNAITLADYERTGGIEGAVADSAQRAYDGLTPAQQTVARQVFLRLVATSSDGMDTADRATRTELTEGASATEAKDVEQVLEAFAAQRLLTLAADTVEISHEVLLTAWPLLRDTWLADTHADRIVRTRLHNTATDWERHHRDPSYLYTGSLLEIATNTAARIGADPAHHPPLSQTERDFLDASNRAHQRARRRRLGLLGLLTVLVIGFASIAILAVQARQQAVHERDVAISGQLISQSQLLGDTNPVLAKLLSIAAWRIHPSPEARYAMLATAALPGIWAVTSHSGTVNSVAFSPSGEIIASAGSSIRLWNTASGRPIGQPLIRHLGLGGGSVAFSPNGTTLASLDSVGTVRLWNVATHQQIGAPLTSTGPAYSMTFSPNGKSLAIVGVNGPRLWSVATHRRAGHLFISHDVASVAFSPDGKTLAVVSFAGPVRLWNIATGQQTGPPLTAYDGPRRFHSAAVNQVVDSVAFSPSGTTLATGNNDGTVRLWDVTTHQQIGAPLTGTTGPVNSVAFSPSGTTLATGNNDGTVRLWHVPLSQQISDRRTGRHGARGAVAFSPNGTTLATISKDGMVRLWDLTTGHQINGSAIGYASPANAVAFSPDSKTLATGNDGTVRLWDVATHRQIGHPLTAHSYPILSVQFSPDGKVLASDNTAGTVRFWDVATHRQIGSPLFGGADSVAFSTDGKILATDDAAADGPVRLWDVATHRQIGHPFANRAQAVAFSPDGKTLATADADGAVQLWDVATHQIGSPFANRAQAVAFSPDGKTLATADADGTVQLWDVATHRQIGSPPTGESNSMLSVAFSPDGKTLVGDDYDGTVQVWNVAYLIDIAQSLCRSANQSLTHAEWARYAPGLAYQTTCP